MHNNEQDNNETCYNYLTNMRSTLGQNRVIEKASISYKNIMAVISTIVISAVSLFFGMA